MAFVTLKLKVFKKQKYHLILPFSVHLLPFLNNERWYSTLLAFENGAIEHILRGKIWLYGFDSVFSQNII